MTLTSNSLPDPQVLLAAGLSDLAALAAPDGPSETKPAVPSTTASRRPLGLGDESSSLVKAREVRDGAATMPPPRVVTKFEPGVVPGSTARARPSLGVDATPTHDAVDRRRPAATPPTDAAAAAQAPPSAAFDSRVGASAAGRAVTLATPVDSRGPNDARRCAARPVGVSADDTRGANEAASAPASATEAARATAAANVSRSLLSPATAAAVELLAGVGATAAPPGRGAARAEGYARDDGVLGSEALYSKFAAAAEPGDPGGKEPGAVPRPAALPEPGAPDSLAREAAAAAGRASSRPGKKRRTLSQAVEQFQFETEKAAAEALMGRDGSGRWGRGVPAARSRGVSAAPASARPETAGDGEAAVGAAALFATLAPPPKKRKPRRWLSEDEKVFTCGIDGCVRSYGSASSLCAHKRAHHPGWKERRERRREEEAPARKTPAPEEEEEDADDDEDDVAGRQARKEGSKALDASARLTPSGAWIESLAADAHARLGALRRSRQRVQRGVRDARACLAAECQPSEAAGGAPLPSASSVAAAAATRLLQSMETALEAEADNLHVWLEKIERVAELRQNAGRALFPEEDDAATARLTGGFAAPAPMGPAEARAAARTARETASALAAAAAAFGQGGKKKDQAAKPADRG